MVNSVAQSTILLLHATIVDYVMRRHHDHGKEERDAHLKLENMGFQVGLRLGERLSLRLNLDRTRLGKTVDIIKFICKEFWTELFQRQVNNLRTNHRGIYMLLDNEFQWLQYNSAPNMTSSQLEKYVMFPSGIIRGALSSLGIESTVTPDVHLGSSNKPATCNFKIEIKNPN
eukprot:gb/GECH01002493.1/.p1 GENE.gb/GECH01002493.1/~~gb/GECH01002493.1/.p1  ORF type:complete len:172 (+),score=29.61 gb/GECH01002493.1/:1-516(+)